MNKFKYTGLFISACCGCLIVNLSWAAEEKIEPFQWDFKTIERVESADIAKGEELAKKLKCSKCHGDTGISDEDDTPSISGQTASYLFKQLLDYRVKERREKQMHKASKKLGIQDMADIAAWYATQQAEPSKSGGKEPPVLVTKGDKDRLLLPCNVCHGKNGEGYGYETPALTGQRMTHFVDTMTEFREDDRENDLYGRMRFIAKQLTEEEIEVLAEFYASEPPVEE